MGKICDLHAHSVFSDGTYTPAQLLQEAREKGISALALTDHNTVAGLPDFLAAGELYPDIEIIAGVEFSTDYRGTELHILALGVKPGDFATVTEMTRRYHIRKEESNRALAENLQKIGCLMDYDRIKTSTPNGQVNRALIGAELMKLGYVSSMQEAFQKYLNPSCGYYVPPKREEPAAMLDFIRQLGAVSVLAHPLLNLTPGELRRFLQELGPRRPVGMEVLYSTYSEEETRIVGEMADEFGILHSGGSDFHGSIKPDIALGQGKGHLKVPYSLWEKLKKHIA